MTRGHNIVADGWAGAANPNPHLTSPQHPTYTQTYAKSTQNTRFPTFQLDHPGLTDQWTNGRTKPLIDVRVRN